METAPILRLVRHMGEIGVFIDPLLNNTIWRTTDPELQAQIATIVEDLCLKYVGFDKVFVGFEDLPYSVALMRFCVCDAVVTTACSIAYERHGAVYPAMSDIQQAGKRVKQFMEDLGASVLYRLYLLVAGYDILQPLARRKMVTEEEFLYAICHHPYTEEQLDLFLMFGLARKTLRIKLVDDVRMVQLTKLGREIYEWTIKILEQAKYIDKRIAMSYVYQFDVVQDWDDMCRQVWPDAGVVRQKFATWVGMPESAQILDIACGTDSYTFDEGVRFELSSDECLPFSDGQFDACVGSAFLHFADTDTDMAIAIAEMARVVVPGGMVAILQGLDFALDRPFFQEWFEPVFKISRQVQWSEQKTYLPNVDDLSTWFVNAGIVDIESSMLMINWVFDCPEVVVQHMVRGIRFFQHAFIHLAWSDRKSMIRELIDRGRDVCQRYSLVERTICVPSMMLKGRRPIEHPVG